MSAPAVSTAPRRPPSAWRLHWPWRWPLPLALGLLSAALGFSISLLMQEQRLLSVFSAAESNSFRWVVFLKSGADRPSLEERLRSLPGVQRLEFTTKEQALETAQRDPALADALKLTVRNPFPESFDAEWNPDFLRPEYLGPLSEQITTWDGVDRVGYDAPRLDRIALLARLRSQRRAGISVAVWGALAVGVLLAGRWLFFGRRWRVGETLSTAAVGAVGGAAGAVAVAGWLGEFLIHGAAAGLALGVLTALGRAVADE
ncbi:MAG: hypothetical protein IPP68_09695 [Elusimicrobia bacterium]|nr:hypothetical protein [Elusimicrobiota bacterium]